MSRSIRLPVLTSSVAAFLLLVLGLLVLAPSSTAKVESRSVSTAPQLQARPPSSTPTIVFVHGAFADSSGWSEVMQRLHKAGYPVLAFSNPLRGPVHDGDYLRAFLSTIEGPIVLVGHSYGGVVITNAATGNPQVTSLVYVAAYAPAAGENVAEANHLGGGHTEVTDHLVIRPYPGAPENDADAYIEPSAFPRLFAQDLPRQQARFMAATQRPGALASLVTPSGQPAWESIPSYFAVAENDRIIPPEAQLAMADRAGAHTIRLDSSHVAMMTKPGRIVSLVMRASR